MTALRVLHVASNLPRWGGIERHICDVAPALAARGHEVAVVCPPGSPIEQRLRESTVRTIPLTITRLHDWGKLLPFMRAMRGRYDVVHTHQGWDRMVPGVAAYLRGVRAVVMSQHAAPKFRASGLLLQRILYDGIVAVSGVVGRLLLENGISPERVFVVQNGIDVGRWRSEPPTPVRKQLSIPSDAFLVVGAGRLSTDQDKGFAFLVRALALARRRGVNAFCLIAGRGDPLPLKNLIASLDLSPFAIYLGERRDIPGLFAAANAVATPSTLPEGFGYSALEGLASGRPVIASRVGGLTEIVTSKVGYLLPPGDPEAISHAIEDLAADRDKCRRMGEAALARANQFSLDESVGKLERVYECILNRSDNGTESFASRGVESCH